ncbi:MAG TPA: WG repeat-containing protein [Candidatus Coprenecus pullistercoris]|nr:WG repeat-containing protein [Candidatus Coprenecus pullistercoris]
MRQLLISIIMVCCAVTLRASDLIPYQDAASGKWGYRDASGKVVVRPVYSAVSRFADGYGVVYSDSGLAGLVESSGRVVIQPRYTYIDLCNEGIVAVYRCPRGGEMWVDGAWTFIDLAYPDILMGGLFCFDMVGPFVDSVAWVNRAETDSKRAVRYMPVMSRNGKKEIGREYILGVSESFGMSDLYAKDDDGRPVVYDGAWVLIDREMRILTDAERPYQMVGEFKDGLAWVKRDGLYGFVNTEGEEVIPVIYRSVQGAPNAVPAGLLLNPEDGAVRWVMNGKGEMAWMDGNGDTVIDFVRTDGRIGVSSFVNESMWDY